MAFVRQRVLLVEDNRSALTGLFTLLSDAGFIVLTATDGDDAINFIEHGMRPDVIVLDLLMPKVSGWEVIEHLQHDVELREIPVVVMTALEPDAANVVGADVVLYKPIQPAQLLEVVDRLAAQRKPRTRERMIP